MHLAVILLAIVTVTSSSIFSSIQYAAIEGNLACSLRPLDGHVKLMEKDWGSSDDFLNSTLFNENMTHFRVFGVEDEIGKIEPYLIIDHNCNERGKYVELTVRLSDVFIMKEEEVKDWQPVKSCDVGTINLATAVTPIHFSCIPTVKAPTTKPSQPAPLADASNPEEPAKSAEKKEDVEKAEGKKDEKKDEEKKDDGKPSQPAPLADASNPAEPAKEKEEKKDEKKDEEKKDDGKKNENKKEKKEKGSKEDEAMAMDKE